uniref:ELYS-like domain-containing protein n=1 Tax=Strongyloides stercoralis TaxID=6248 RepID=A0A0K0ESB1_STRER
MLEEWYSFDYLFKNYTSMPKDKRLGYGRILAAYYINLELALPLENLPSLLSWNDKVLEGTKSGILEIIDRKMFVNVLSLGYEPGVAVIILLKEGNHLEAMYFLSHFMDIRSDLIVRLLLDSYNISKKALPENFFTTRLYYLIDICMENYKIIQNINNKNNDVKMKIKNDAIKFSKAILEIEKVFNNNIILSTLVCSFKNFEKYVKFYNSTKSIWNFCESLELEDINQLNLKLYFIFNIFINLSFECHKLHEFLDILEVYFKLQSSIIKEPFVENIEEKDKFKIDYSVLEKAFFSNKIISIFLDIFLLLVKMEYTQNFKEKYENSNENESKMLLKEIYKLFGEKDSNINCLKFAIQNSKTFCEKAFIVLKACKNIGKEKVFSNDNNHKYYEKKMSINEEKKIFGDINIFNRYKEKIKSMNYLKDNNCSVKLLQFSKNLGIYNLYDNIIDNDKIYKRMYFISKIWTSFPLVSSGLIPLKINLKPKLFINLSIPNNVLYEEDIINALNISTDFKHHNILIDKIIKTLDLVRKTVEEVENINEVEKNVLMVRYNNNYKDDKIVSKINNYVIEDAAMMINKAKSMAKKSVAKEMNARKDIKKEKDLEKSFKSKILEITVSKNDVFPKNNDEIINNMDKEKIILEEFTNSDKNNISFSQYNKKNINEIKSEKKIIDNLNLLHINKQKHTISSSNSSSISYNENKLSTCRMKRRVKRIRKNNLNKQNNFLYMSSHKFHQQKNQETSTLSISSLSSIEKKNETELIYPSDVSLNIGPTDVINENLDKPSSVARLDLRCLVSPLPEKKEMDKKIISENTKDSFCQTTIFSPLDSFSKNIKYEFIDTYKEISSISTRSENNRKNLPSSIITTNIPDWLCMLPLDSTRNLYSTRVLTIKDRNLLKEIKNKGVKYGLKKRKEFDSGFNDDIYDNF